MMLVGNTWSAKWLFPPAEQQVELTKNARTHRLVYHHFSLEETDVLNILQMDNESRSHLAGVKLAFYHKCYNFTLYYFKNYPSTDEEEKIDNGWIIRYLAILKRKCQSMEGNCLSTYKYGYLVMKLSDGSLIPYLLPAVYRLAMEGIYLWRSDTWYGMLLLWRSVPDSLCRWFWRKTECLMNILCSPQISPTPSSVVSSSLTHSFSPPPHYTAQNIRWCMQCALYSQSLHIRYCTAFILWVPGFLCFRSKCASYLDSEHYRYLSGCN